MSKAKRCGTCKYWEETGESLPLISQKLGRCNFAEGYIPSLGLQGSFVVEDDGDDCPEWEEREDV